MTIFNESDLEHLHSIFFYHQVLVILYFRFYIFKDLVTDTINFCLA